MLPKAILFDMDDTILSHDAVCDPAWEKVCRDFASKTRLVDYPDLWTSICEVKSWYWSDAGRHRNGRLDLVKARREIVGMALSRLKIAKDHAMEIADNYTLLQEELMHPFPGAVETLEELRKGGIRLALLTNGSAETQWRKIKRFDLTRYFELILIEGELGFGKPDPRVFQTALRILDVAPQETWMVGDNLQWEIGVPQKMGIYAVWNDYSRRGLLPNSEIIPDRIIHSISELIPLET